MRHLTIVGVLVLAALPVIQCQASEKDELTLIMRQLDQVQAGLDRARVVANQNQNARFYFDYQQATAQVSGPVDAVFTLPENSTLVGSKAMTALLGG